MIISPRHLVTRPLVGWWLSTSPDSWRRHVVPADSPHVHARGADPDRVLLAGDGAATGRGVITHDLGLPGFLARALTGHTGRATDVDAVVSGDMTARRCLTALADVQLDRFDIIVLTVGANEALALTPAPAWEEALGALLDDVGERSPAATRIFVLPIPFFGVNPRFPRRLARVVDEHVQTLNAATSALVARLPGVEIVPVAQTGAFTPEGSHVYHRWAETIAVRISAALDPARVVVGSTETEDEQGRQEALRALEGLRPAGDADTVLDDLAEKARRAFGTTIAAVTLIESDVQVMRAARGIDPVVLPRDEAFCDITIRRASHFVVEDASLDSRYADYSIVAGDPGVKFYAGYPIESPDGQRVGALCIMDTEPRRFTPHDAALLRTLAQGVQDHLWREES
jgi:GAF domain-containing protein